MKISVGLYGNNAHHIALALIQGFNKHYKLFRATSKNAKARFEQADWLGVHKAVRERIRFYDDRVDECVERLHDEFDSQSLTTPPGSRSNCSISACCSITSSRNWPRPFSTR
jgi:isocitrate dehydrogenase kinase/phosphatase